jgi:peptide/nickel transport system substrate-binding protein
MAIREMKMDKKMVGAVLIIAVILIGIISYTVFYHPATTPETQEVLRIGCTDYLKSPDPLLGAGSLDEGYGNAVFDRLWTIDTVNKTKLYNQLVESYRVYELTSGDPVIDFTLRKGYKFQDGTTLDADDVINAWNYRVEQEGMDYVKRGAFKNKGTAYEKVDDYTVRGHLNSKFAAYFFIWCEALFLKGTPPVSSESIEKVRAGQATTTIAGGPYRLVEFVKNDRIVLEAWDGCKDNYKDGMLSRVPKIKNVIIRMYSDPATMAMALAKGEIDIAWKDLYYEDLARFMRDSDFVVESSPCGYFRFLHMVWDGPLADVRVRQAIAYAINQSEINEKSYLGFGNVPKSNLHDWMPYYKPYFDEKYNVTKSDVEQAKALMAEAGYPDGFKTEFYVAGHFSPVEVEKTTATIIAAQLAQIGIDLDIKIVDYGYLNPLVESGGAPMTIWGYKYDYIDPDVDVFYHMDPRYGYDYVTSAKYPEVIPEVAARVEELIDEGRNLWSADNPLPPEREQIYDELQQINTNYVIDIPIIVQNEYEVYAKYVKGYHIMPNAYHHMIWNATIEKGEEPVTSSMLLSYLPPELQLIITAIVPLRVLTRRSLSENSEASN